MLIIDAYLQYLYDNITNKGYTITAPHNEANGVLYLFGSAFQPPNWNQAISICDNDTVIFEFRWRHLVPVTLRFEFHGEYVTVDTVLDLSQEIELPYAPGSVTLRDNVQTTFDSLLESLNRHDSRYQDYTELHETIYKRIWSEFDSEIFRGLQHTQLGYLIGDLRWLVLGSYLCSKDNFHSLSSYSTLNDFQPPFSQPLRENGVIPSHYYTRPRDSRWALSKVAMLWNFMISAKGLEGCGKYEFTASRLLDGQVLYISALGPQPDSQNAACPELCPVFSILYSNTLNPWQIGNLSDRLNRLGTVRLAATMDIGKLRLASNAIRDIRANIFLSIRNFQKGLQSGISRKEIDDKLTALDIAYMRAETDTVALGMGKVKDIELDIGLESRIDRCKNYLTEWRSGLNALRIRRLEGFTPYDEFIERRLGVTFQFIDNIGTRYQHLIRNVEELHSYFISKSQLNIAELTKDKEIEIATLQKTAEFLAFAFLIPYYAASTITHSFFDEEHNSVKMRTNEVPINFNVDVSNNSIASRELPLFGLPLHLRITAKLQPITLVTTPKGTNEKKPTNPADKKEPPRSWRSLLPAWFIETYDWLHKNLPMFAKVINSFRKKSAHEEVWIVCFAAGILVAIGSPLFKRLWWLFKALFKRLWRCRRTQPSTTE